MNNTICVDCGNPINSEDSFSETCYECQNLLISYFPIIAQNLNLLISQTKNNENLNASEKKLRIIALAASIKIFGEEPDIEIEDLSEYLDDSIILCDALNRLLDEIEQKTKQNKIYAWQSYSLIHAIKEFGGNPNINFKDSNFFNILKLGKK